jgi:hypothetical protein
MQSRQILHISTQTALLVALAIARSGAADKVVFTIFAEIQFAVPADWEVVANKSDTKSTLFAFKIPNPAEEGTPDPTNLLLQSFYLKDPGAKAKFEEKSKAQDPDARKRPVAAHWDCTSFTGKQGSTSYDVWDCHQTVAKAGVYVRLAWPHLSSNPPNYDEQMQATLVDVLTSVGPPAK